MFGFVNHVFFQARLRAHRFLHEENGEVNIVATVVLIGIAVILAIAFKGQIQNLLNGLFQQIGTNANSAVS